MQDLSTRVRRRGVERNSCQSPHPGGHEEAGSPAQVVGSGADRSLRDLHCPKDIFKNLRDAVIRDPVQKTSADIPATLRTVLDSTPIGHLTAPEVTRQGVEMVALCARKPTTVDTPKKREIRDKMFADKFEAKSKSYLQEVRKAAMIEYR